MIDDFTKSLVKLKVQWLVRAEYFEDQYTSACVQCAGELGEVLKLAMSSDEFTAIAEPIAKHERLSWESRGHEKTKEAKRIERFREQVLRLHNKQNAADAKKLRR